MNNYLVITENDNVMVALTALKKGDVVNGITLLEDVDRGHKIALKDINQGENIIKYNAAIGHALVDIKQGSWVHVHNIKTNLNDTLEYEYTPKFENVISNSKARTVNVYLRKNGDVGIRNELWVIPTVGCVSAQAKTLVKVFETQEDTSRIDGVSTFTHPYGCSQMGDDHINTRTELQNMVKHPNAGGVLVLGLGCENNQISAFKETLGEYDESRVKFLAIQDVVGDEIQEGIKILKELYNNMKNDKRVEMPISCLKVGLECGGSDGFSGITANPLIGRFSDYLISNGGTSVLTEVPEMFGAETILMRRAKDENTFNKVVGLINDFKDYYKRHGQVIYENPSPGNKKGGITTLEDKSLGCTQKAGASKVMDVLNHTDLITKKGLNLLSAPGNDLVATTALGICGCHMVLFSTGRGTPFGGFIPTIKISTNTDLYQRKPNWIDFNAGRLVGEKTMDELLEDFIDLIVEVANGKKTRNEINDFREIAIFKSGVTL